jgi:hypothetical protein
MATIARILTFVLVLVVAVSTVPLRKVAAQQVALEPLLKLPDDELSLVMTGLRRSGRLRAEDVATAMHIADVEQVRMLVRELGELAPLPDSVVDDVKAFAADCPIELLGDVRMLLEISQALGVGAERSDPGATGIQRTRIDEISQDVRDRLSHARAVTVELMVLSPERPLGLFVAVLHRCKTAEAAGVAARLLVKRGVAPDEALTALDAALDRFGRKGVENASGQRCLWIADAICRLFPNSPAAVKAWAYVACNGDAVERAEAHAALRRCAGTFEIAIPYLRSCLTDCVPMDPRVLECIETLALRFEHASSFEAELRSLAERAEGRVQRLARSLLALGR